MARAVSQDSGTDDALADDSEHREVTDADIFDDSEVELDEPPPASPRGPVSGRGSGVAPRSSADSGSRRASRSFRGSKIPSQGSLLAGKYEVERIASRSSCSVDVDARHVELGQRVSVRYLLPDALRRGDVVARFLRGARSASRLRSEHVPRVVDVGRFRGGMPFVVSEALEGWSLSDVLRARGALPVQEAVEYTIQACSAVAEAHSHGMLHGSLNLSNLILSRRLDDSPLVKVTNLGTTEPFDVNGFGDSSSSGNVIASLSYVAPEQIRAAQDVDRRADIWALGAILHALLTGDPPFIAPTAIALLASIAADEPVVISDIRDDVAPELDAAIQRCLMKEREMRFDTVHEFAVALRSFASGDAVQTVERMSRLVGRAPRATVGPPARALVPVPRPKTTPPPLPTLPPPALPNNNRWLASAAVTGGAAGLVVLIGAMVGVAVFRVVTPAEVMTAAHAQPVAEAPAAQSLVAGPQVVAPASQPVAALPAQAAAPAPQAAPAPHPVATPTLAVTAAPAIAAPATTTPLAAAAAATNPIAAARVAAATAPVAPVAPAPQMETGGPANVAARAAAPANPAPRQVVARREVAHAAESPPPQNSSKDLFDDTK